MLVLRRTVYLLQVLQHQSHDHDRPRSVCLQHDHAHWASDPLLVAVLFFLARLSVRHTRKLNWRLSRTAKTERECDNSFESDVLEVFEAYITVRKNSRSDCLGVV